MHVAFSYFQNTSRIIPYEQSTFEEQFLTTPHNIFALERVYTVPQQDP